MLNDIEAYVNDHPDSALSVLEKVDSSVLTTRSLRAKRSLLWVMARDKCYLDITEPQLLNPAIAWYNRHGSADEKMKTLYYQGRIAQDNKDQNSAAVFYAQAEEYAAYITDYHALALLYIAEFSVYNAVYNIEQERLFVEKALEVLKKTNDPMYESELGDLAMVYHSQKQWEIADSLYRHAINHSEAYPHAQALYLSNYARMKLQQPEKDPAGAIELLNRKRVLCGGALSPKEAGAYAYAAVLSGKLDLSGHLVVRLKELKDENHKQVLPWLYRIALFEEDPDEALVLFQEMRYQEEETINSILSDSVSQALQNYKEQRIAQERNRRLREVLVLILVLLVVTLISVCAVFNRKSVEAERDRLLRLCSALNKEMKEHETDYAKLSMELDTTQIQNLNQSIQLGEREEQLSDIERRLNIVKESFDRERMNRFRQAGNIGSIIWLKEKKRISDAAAWRLLKQELVYIHHLDGNGAELIRRMDHELDGMISRLRDDLKLRGKPQEMLFLCCCILDMDASVLADLAGKDSIGAVYKKRSRLKAKVLSLGKPEYRILFKERKSN